MNVHAPGFMVAEQYRDRLVAAGVIDAEPQQPLFSDSPRDSGTSDAGAETLSAPVSSDGRSGCPRPPTGPAVSHSTNEETAEPAGTGSAV